MCYFRQELFTLQCTTRHPGLFLLADSGIFSLLILNFIMIRIPQFGRSGFRSLGSIYIHACSGCQDEPTSWQLKNGICAWCMVHKGVRGSTSRKFRLNSASRFQESCAPIIASSARVRQANLVLDASYSWNRLVRCSVRKFHPHHI